MQKKVMILFCLVFILFQALTVSALEREKFYKGDRDALLKEGDRFFIDDLKIRVRSIDHVFKEVVLEFSVHGTRLERVVLRRGEEYQFQNKLKLSVLDVFRRGSDHRREKYVRLELEPSSSGMISEIQLPSSFGKKPYVLIENTGLTTESFFITVSSQKKTHEIKLEKQYVTLDPFESKKIKLNVRKKNLYEPDIVAFTLYHDGKKIDVSQARI